MPTALMPRVSLYIVLMGILMRSFESIQRKWLVPFRIDTPARYSAREKSPVMVAYVSEDLVVRG